MQHNTSKNNGRRRQQSRPQPYDDDPSRHSLALVDVHDEDGRRDDQSSATVDRQLAASSRRDIASLPSTAASTTARREAPMLGPLMSTGTSTTSISSSHTLPNHQSSFMVHGRGGSLHALPSSLPFHHPQYSQHFPPPPLPSVPFSTPYIPLGHQPQQHLSSTVTRTSASMPLLPSSSGAPALPSPLSLQHQSYTRQQERAVTRPERMSMGRTRLPTSHFVDPATKTSTTRTIEDNTSNTTISSNVSIGVGVGIGERMPESYGTMITTTTLAPPIEGNIYTSIEQRPRIEGSREQALSRSTEDEDRRPGEEGQTTGITGVPTTTTTTTTATPTTNNPMEAMQASHLPSSDNKGLYTGSQLPFPPPTTSSYEDSLHQHQPLSSTSTSTSTLVQRQHAWSAVRDQQREEVTMTTSTTSFSGAFPSSSTGPVRHTHRPQRSHPHYIISQASSSPSTSSSSSPLFHPYLSRRRSVPTPRSQASPLPEVVDSSTNTERQLRLQQEQQQTQTHAQGLQQPSLPSHPSPLLPFTAYSQRHQLPYHRGSFSYSYAPADSSRLPYAHSSTMPQSIINQGPFPPPYFSAVYHPVSGPVASNIEYSMGGSMTSEGSANASTIGSNPDTPGAQSHPQPHQSHSFQPHPHLHTHSMPNYSPTMPFMAHRLPPPQHAYPPAHESFSSITPATGTESTYSPRPDTAVTSLGYLSGAGGIPTGDEGDAEDQEEEEPEEGEQGEGAGDIISSPRLTLPHVGGHNVQENEDDTRHQPYQEEEEEHNTGEVEDSMTIATKEKRRKKQDPRPHKCDICDKTFPRPSALETHKTVHSGAKPYNCPVVTCNKSFAVRSNARRHLKTHGIKLKTRDRKSRSKAASLNKALGNLGDRVSGGEGNRDTSPDNDVVSEGDGEERAFATTTTTMSRVLSRGPGAGLRPAAHRGHVNTHADDDEVLGLGGIEPLSSEIEILQRPEEDEDEETSEEEVEGDEGAKVKRQSLRIGAGRKVIIETAGVVVSKRRQSTSASVGGGGGRAAKEKGKGKEVVDSVSKLRGKRRGVAEARRQRGVESGRDEGRHDERAEEIIEPSLTGVHDDGNEEESGEAPVLDQEELRNLWASTQRRHMASSSASVGGGGEGSSSSMTGASGRQSATMSSLPKMDQEALEKLIAAPTAWENYQRQLKMRRELAASTSATGTAGVGGVGAPNERVGGTGGGGIESADSAASNGHTNLPESVNQLDKMIAMAHSQIGPLHSGSSVMPSFGSLGHASSSVRTSVMASSSSMLPSPIYFDQQRPAAVAVNGVTVPAPHSDIVNRPWINPTSSSSSASSLSPVEDGMGAEVLAAIRAAADSDTNTTRMDITHPPTNEEESTPNGFARFDGTWVPDSMRQFKNMDRLRNSAPFDDLGLSTLQMQFPLTGGQPLYPSTSVSPLFSSLFL